METGNREQGIGGLATKSTEKHKKGLGWKKGGVGTWVARGNRTYKSYRSYLSYLSYLP